MKNEHLWKPTKFILRKGKLRASRDPKEVYRGSRFIADIGAHTYQKLIANHAKGSLLDLGCGQAPLYGTYRNLVDETTCIDWGNSAHHTGYADHLTDLNNQLPLASSSFDTILSTDVLEHIAKPQQLLCEMKRLLRPDGKLLLAVPFLYWVHEQPHDYHRYTEYSLQHMCSKAGLTPLEIAPYGGAWEVGMDLIAKHLGRRPLLSNAHLWFAHMTSKWRRPKPRRVKTWRLFPLGYTLVATPERVG